MRTIAIAEPHRRIALLATLMLNLGILALSLTISQATHNIEIEARDPNSYIIVHHKPKALPQNSEQISGIISKSFYTDARARQLPVSIINEITERLSQRFDFNRELKRGDQFQVKFSPKTPQQTATLISFTLQRSGGTIGLYRTVSSDRVERYLDQFGREIDNSFLRYPLKFSGISSKFSMARYHPVIKKVKPHYGVDFKAPLGTPIQAIGDGIVTFSGYKGSAGLMVKIKHHSGYQSSYLHLSKISPSIRPGQRILKGTSIGAVGKSGHATGPHLHFGLSKDGKHLDPLKFQI